MEEHFCLNPYPLSDTRRLTVPKAEEILFHPRHTQHGFVRLVDYLGGDEAVIYAATGGVGRDALVGGSNLSNGSIIKSLVADRIFDPLEFAGQIKLHNMMPISSALFWVYQRPFKINEYSGRYSDMLDEVRTVSQGEMEHFLSDELISLSPKQQRDLIDIVNKTILGTQTQARGSYTTMLGAQFAKELARMGLGLGNFTQFYLSASLPELIEAVKTAKKLSRKNPDLAQQAEEIESICKQVAPETTLALLNNPTRFRTLKLNREALEQKPNGEPRHGISTTKRLTIPTAEEVLFVPQDYLENGWFMPTDYMGSDESIVQSARVSYGKGTTHTSDDITLLRYLRRHRHSTPFEHVSTKAEQSSPELVFPRQGGRHRTLKKAGVLGEYIPLKVFYKLQDEQIRAQSATNRQGRGGTLDDLTTTMIKDSLRSTASTQAWATHTLREKGFPDHIIDNLKGVGHFTRSTIEGDLHNTFHYLSLRDEAHAQHEIQVLARLWSNFVEKVAPLSMQAFKNYQQNAMTFSAQEQTLLTKLLSSKRKKVPKTWFNELGWVTPSGNLSREAGEFNDKIKRLTVVADRYCWRESS